MSESISVALGGASYDVPKLNIGQLRAVTKLLRSDAEDVMFGILGIALKRATPAVPDVDAVEADVAEVGQAISSILEFAGLKRDALQGNGGPAAPAG